MNEHIADLYKIIDEFDSLREAFNVDAHILSLKWMKKVAQMEVERDRYINQLAKEHHAA